MSRRRFLAFAAGAAGAGGALLASGPTAARADVSAATPTLPGEYYRKAAQVTEAGTVYDNICVRIDGDAARLFVPRGVVVGSPTAIAWFYHGAGTDHFALEAGFRREAEAIVDRRAVAICQTAGGTLFSHPTAVSLQIAGAAYMESLFPSSINVQRATSAGGALAIATSASRLLPRLLGAYLVNATYDLRAHYAQGGARGEAMAAVFGGNLAAMDAANPARHASAVWSGTRLRIVVAAPSETDTSVPPDDHGLALRARALPTAAEASVRTHGNGHTTPAFARPDFLETIERWGLSAVDDTTPPSVRILEPENGAVLSGVVTARVSASDDVDVVDVGFYAGTLRLATARRVDGEPDRWQVVYDTSTGPARNGTYSVTARATDGRGNVGTSAPIRVTIAN